MNLLNSWFTEIFFGGEQGVLPQIFALTCNQLYEVKECTHLVPVVVV